MSDLTFLPNLGMPFLSKKSSNNRNKHRISKDMLNTIEESPMSPSICPAVFVFTCFKMNFNDKEFKVNSSEKTDQKAFIYLLTGLEVNVITPLIVAKTNDIFQFFKSSQDIKNEITKTNSVM